MCRSMADVNNLRRIPETATGGTMGLRRSGLVLVFMFALLTCAASSATAQSAIAGSVKDSTGLVLPGVTVEASSSALIERLRSTISDGQGLYQITNLPPGTYKVSFSLPGFTTYVR